MEVLPANEIALSTCKAKYICLSQALQKVILPIMDLMQELKDKGIPVGCSQPRVKCKMFKDNSAVLTLANAPAMHPRTKHINVKYHFFRCHAYSSFETNRSNQNYGLKVRGQHCGYADKAS